MDVDLMRITMIESKNEWKKFVREKWMSNNWVNQNLKPAGQPILDIQWAVSYYYVE